MPPVVAVFQLFVQLAAYIGIQSAAAQIAFAVAMTVAVYTAMAATVYGAMSLMTAPQRRRMRQMARDAKGITHMSRDNVQPTATIYGQRQVAGPLIFANEYGDDREDLYMVVPICAHEVDSLVSVHFNDEIVTFHPTTHICTSNNYKDKAWFWFQTGGAGSDAFTQLRLDLPSKWTADHKLEGCAAFCVKLLYDQKMYAYGIPNVSVTVKGKKLYDPRTGLTTWSSNPALVAADILTDPIVGAGVPWSKIDTDELIASANICDEIVPLAGSPATPDSATRFSCHFYYNSAQGLEGALEIAAETMIGAVFRSSGKWYVRAGAYRTPTIGLSDSDLLDMVTVHPRRTRLSLFNGVRGVFVDSTNGYAPTDFPSVASATYLAQDAGERLWNDIDLPATMDHIQAQRIAKFALEACRQQITVSLKVGLRGLLVKPTDTVMLTLPRFGWTNKVFQVDKWVLEFAQTSDQNHGSAVSVRLELSETSAGVYAWNAEETGKDPSPDTDLPNPFLVGAPTSPAITQDKQISPSGTLETRIKITWTAPADIFVTEGGRIRARYKLSTDSVWIDAGAVSGELTEMNLVLPLLLAGSAYNFAISAENNIGVQSAWVSCSPDPFTVLWDTVAPATPTGGVVATPESAYYPAEAGRVVATASPLFRDSGTVFSWTPNTDADLSHYEVTAANATPAFSHAGTPVDGRNYHTFHWGMSPPTGAYAYVRAVDTSGNKSDWSAAATGPSGGNMALVQGVLSRDLVTQSSGNIQSTGITLGGAGSTPKILVQAPMTISRTTAGGASTETFTVDISGRGFSTAPDNALSTPSNTAAADYILAYQKASSTSTSASYLLRRLDGATIPAGVALTFSVNLIEVD